MPKDLIIGRTGTFMRETLNKQQKIEQILYEGTILDKFSGRDKFDNRIYIIDFYLVEIFHNNEYVVTPFACNELVKLKRLKAVSKKN